MAGDAKPRQADLHCLIKPISSENAREREKNTWNTRSMADMSVCRASNMRTMRRSGLSIYQLLSREALIWRASELEISSLALSHSKDFGHKTRGQRGMTNRLIN